MCNQRSMKRALTHLKMKIGPRPDVPIIEEDGQEKIK